MQVPATSWSGVCAKIESGRVRLPSDVAQQISWLADGETVDAWLVLLELGRYRLVSHRQAEQDNKVGPTLRRLAAPSNGTVTEDASEFESAPLAALACRLIPTVVSSRGPGWRITLPKEVITLVPPSEDRSQVFLLFSVGFLEIWFPDTLRRALSTPLGEALA